MLISSIETFASEYVTLVRVRTDDGDEGWGQVSPYHADITAQVVHRQVACHVLGMDANDIDAVTAIVLDREHKQCFQADRRWFGSHRCWFRG